MSEHRPWMQSRAVAVSYKLTGTRASQHPFRKVWLELRQRLAVYCDARLRLLDEPQHRRTRGLDDRCDLCRLTATPNHELGGSVDAPRCAGEHPRKAAGQIWGQKRDLNPSAAAVEQRLFRRKRRYDVYIYRQTKPALFASSHGFYCSFFCFYCSFVRGALRFYCSPPAWFTSPWGLLQGAGGEALQTFSRYRGKYRCGKPFLRWR